MVSFTYRPLLPTRRDPLLLISVSGRIDPGVVVRIGRLSQRKISMTPLFLLPVLSDITPKYYVSATCAVRYTPTVLLFLLPVIKFIPKVH